MTKGFRILKNGADLNTTDLRNVLLDAQYGMFKYHLDQTKSMTINGGDTEKTISFAHGLGYVPAFIAYYESGGSITSMPRRDVTAFSGIDRSWFSYADDTNIYIKWRSVIPYNQETLYDVDSYSSLLGRYYWTAGNSSGTGMDGAFLFDPVNFTGSESITSATLVPYVGTKGSSSSNTKFRCYGIDEDDTANFGGSPLGRPQTSATVTQEQAPATTPFDFNIDVTDMFNEIRQRGGWSSGNAMGFMLFNNSSDTDAYLAGFYSGNKLVIQKPGSTTYNFRVIVFKDKISD